MSTTLYLRNYSFGASTFDRLTLGRGSGVSNRVTNTTGGGTQITWTRLGGGATAEWISHPSPVGGWTLSGTITFNVWFLESNLAANCGVQARVYRRTPGGTETEVSGSPFVLGGPATEF